ncbi:MAG TPA: DUF1028 domain-containing protein [Rhizobium sp.]
MTFSITARCPDTGAFGVAISSSSIAVASRCAWPDPLGVVTSQNLTNPALGPAGQRLLRQGLGAKAILSTLLAGDPDPSWRQVAVVDRYGQVAWHSGTQAFADWNVSVGEGVVAMGNLLASPRITDAMLDAFTSGASLALAERLMRSLEAGIAAGGEIQPVRSAGIKVCHQLDWAVTDLRVDWDEEPISRLREIRDLYAAEEAAFILRASNPSKAFNQETH